MHSIGLKLLLVSLVLDGASRSSDSSSCGGIADKDGADQTANNNALSPPRETTPLAEYENKLSRCFRWCDRFQDGWRKWGEAVGDGGGGGGGADGLRQRCFHRQETQDAQVPHLQLLPYDSNFL